MSILFYYLPESFGSSFCETEHFSLNHKKKEAELFCFLHENNSYYNNLPKEDLYSNIDLDEASTSF